MSMDYGMNPLMMGNYDWYSMLPYMQKVLQTPNPNFKGNTEVAKTNAAQEMVTTPVQANNGAIPVTMPVESDEGSSTLSTLTGIGAVLAIGGGALYMLKKGNFGKASEVVKSMFNGGKGEASSVSNILKRLTAVKNKNGDIRFMIPGKTTTIKGKTAAESFAEENCIKESLSLQRQKFNSENSAISTFTCASGTNKYTVKVEDGVITSIKDQKNTEILKDLTEAAGGTPEAKQLESFNNILNELKKEKDVDATLLSGVTGIKYTNTFGDDVLHMSLAKYGDAPLLNEFTTLQRFKFSDPEMQSLVLNADEKVFAEYAEKGLITKNGRFSKPRLAEGLKVSSFSKEINGNEYFFEEGQLVKIIKADKTVLLPNSSGYIQLEADNKKAIDGIIKNVFEERTEIPVGATIIPE